MAFAIRTAPRFLEGRRLRQLTATLALGLLLAAAPAFAAVDAVELPAGVSVEHDGAGGLRVVEGKSTLLTIDLRWVSAAEVTPAGSSLSVDAGAQLGGRDEDAAFLSMPPIRALEGARLAARLRHWPYFHVDDIAFVDAALRMEAGAAPLGAVALGIDSERNWELRRLRQRPHLSAGRAPWVEYDLAQVMFERPDGDRLYLGVVRLDRRRAALLDEGRGLVWEAGTRPSWPLAVIAARTRASLEFLAGQALLTYDRAGEALTSESRWKVPPLCGRCRDPRIEDLWVELRVRDGLLHVRTRLRDLESLEHFNAEGLRIDGFALGRHLLRVRGEEAEYGIPLSEGLVEKLIDAATSGALDVEIWTNAELGVRPQHVEVVVEPGTREASIDARRSREPIEEVLPSYLSPQLVSSWPNPFRGDTTIEVTVPATLGEAFDLDESTLARVVPEDPVPFGPTPTVRVRVYNVGGQLVQTLSEEVQSAGRFSVQWNGTDLQGQPVAAGAYYVNVEMGDWSVTRRVLRLAP